MHDGGVILTRSAPASGQILTGPTQSIPGSSAVQVIEVHFQKSTKSTAVLVLETRQARVQGRGRSDERNGVHGWVPSECWFSAVAPKLLGRALTARARAKTARGRPSVSKKAVGSAPSFELPSASRHGRPGRKQPCVGRPGPRCAGPHPVCSLTCGTDISTVGFMNHTVSSSGPLCFAISCDACVWGGQECGLSWVGRLGRQGNFPRRMDGVQLLQHASHRQQLRHSYSRLAQSHNRCTLSPPPLSSAPCSPTTQSTPIRPHQPRPTASGSAAVLPTGSSARSHPQTSRGNPAWEVGAQPGGPDAQGVHHAIHTPLSALPPVIPRPASTHRGHPPFPRHPPSPAHTPASRFV